MTGSPSRRNGCWVAPVDNSSPTPISDEVVLSVPEIRDYREILGELVRHLDRGCRRFRLTGVSGHRLLVSGLAGGWCAAIEVVGDAGPELAAGMDAPDVTVVCRGSAADGGASRLKSGRVLILGAAGPAFGYAQTGGLAMVVGAAGPRAGLLQRGGDLILLGRAGPMAGERQSGGGSSLMPTWASMRDGDVSAGDSSDSIGKGIPSATPRTAPRCRRLSPRSVHGSEFVNKSITRSQNADCRIINYWCVRLSNYLQSAICYLESIVSQPLSPSADRLSPEATPSRTRKTNVPDRGFR